jgi:hypothetical protein
VPVERCLARLGDAICSGSAGTVSGVVGDGNDNRDPGVIDVVGDASGVEGRRAWRVAVLSSTCLKISRCCEISISVMSVTAATSASAQQHNNIPYEQVARVQQELVGVGRGTLKDVALVFSIGPSQEVGAWMIVPINQHWEQCTLARGDGGGGLQTKYGGQVAEVHQVLLRIPLDARHESCQHLESVDVMLHIT